MLESRKFPGCMGKSSFPGIFEFDDVGLLDKTARPSASGGGPGRMGTKNSIIFFPSEKS